MFTSYKEKWDALLMQDKNTPPDDSELLQNFYRDHDNRWLGMLLPRYTLLLLGVCMKYLKNEHEAKDCVQQIFLKVISELHKYPVEHFKSWIYMIAKNHCLMQLRRKDRVPAELREQLTALPDEALEKSRYLERDALLTRMAEAMEQLSPEQKECVSLFYLQKKTYAEISGITGYTMLQVKSYIQNGKRNLRLLIEKR